MGTGFWLQCGLGILCQPGTTFLPIAGPAGTALGLGLGGIVMLILAVNFNYLMNKYPECGGIYTYTKKAFGYDHGFLSAWFLVLTYIAIIWANATALPLIARTVLGDTFRFGKLYQIAGYDIYLGEILLAVGALILAPWAFVGFESITHSAAEAKYSLKKSFRIMAVAVITAAVAYILLSLLAVTARPDDTSSWVDYTGKLDGFTGTASQPTFFAAQSALGDTGSIILGVAALGAILTGLIGNYIALSRLLSSLSDDGLFPAWIGKKDDRHVPKRAILGILLISSFLPFFGRTAISWIVDVTTVGATVAYALASASA